MVKEYEFRYYIRLDQTSRIICAYWVEAASLGEALRVYLTGQTMDQLLDVKTESGAKE